ncbi:MAG: hypothetical protein ACXWBP_01000 [Limisphaerales bacterium]
MKLLHFLKTRFRRRATSAAALVILGLVACSPLTRAEDKAADVKGAEKHMQKPAKTLTGAELYSMHCNRCHPERYPTERTAAQWKTILLHMRVRANLPAKQARTILTYLQDNSGR